MPWHFVTAKKIMYYFVGGPDFKKNPDSYTDWVGDDTLSHSTDEMISLLKSGTPLTFAFNGQSVTGARGGHAVALTQLIKFKNGKYIESYTLWDNNRPYNVEKKDDYDPYLSWIIKKNNDVATTSDYHDANIIHNTTGNKTYEAYKSVVNVCFLSRNGDAGDAQNIYGLRTTSTQLSVSTSRQKTHKTSNSPQLSGIITSADPQLSGTIDVSIIGGQVTGTTNKSTGEIITTVPNGDVTTGQAVIVSTMDGSFNLLQLPSDATYRINAVKLTDVPFLKVFVRIPQVDGTVELLNYDAVQTGETDATQVYFYVGVGNTDKAIRRTAAPATARMQIQAAVGDYPPDFNQTLPTQINPPGNFRAFVENGVVQLGWVNTIHPNLSAVKIVRTTGTYPTSPDDGVTVYDALGTSAQDNTVSIGTLYFYAAYSRDTSSAYSEPVYASVNTYLYSIYGKVALSTDEGVSGASAVLVDGSGQTVGVATSGSDGNYLLSNLEMDAYTLTVSHPSHTIDNPQRSISIEGQNIEENFTAVPVPTLQLLFNPSFVNIGSTVSVPWAYRTIANTETVKIELYRGGVWQTLAASVPILTGNIQWTVTGPADAQAKIRISLNANPSLTNENTFSIVDPNAIGLTGPGWNLISLPLQPSNTAITNVLGSISGKYTSTWAYQNDSWKVFDSANPGLSDLSILETGWGYWLDMTEAATLSVTGTEPSKTINLITGWNLVGYNSSTSQNIADALASIAGKVVSVWAYKNDSWEFYDPANPGLSDLTTMSPGYGYWINTNGVCTWTLP